MQYQHHARHLAPRTVEPLDKLSHLDLAPPNALVKFLRVDVELEPSEHDFELILFIGTVDRPNVMHAERTPFAVLAGKLDGGLEGRESPQCYLALRF